MQWELENNGGVAVPARQRWRVGRRRKNLRARLGTPPPASDSEGAERNVSPNLVRFV